MMPPWRDRAGGCWRLPACFVLLALAACAPALPPATPTPSPTLPSVASPVPLATLPPTWTPTFTPTPAPPTATRTPFPTPTVTPTLSAAGRCAVFWLFARPAGRAWLALSEHRRVTFAWNYPLPGASVTLRVIHTASGQGRTVTIPGPDMTVVTLPFYALYGLGRYHWTATPNDEDSQPLDRCGAEGDFFIQVRPREALRAPLP